MAEKMEECPNCGAEIYENDIFEECRLNTLQLVKPFTASQMPTTSGSIPQ